jgi:uncharacterized membrane protein YkvA (DUF1232 family)
MVDDFVLATLICIGAALLILLVAAGYIAWRLWRSDERRLARRIGKLDFGDKLALGRDLFRDSRVPILARIVAVALVLYIASPIDLLPDFTPVVGFVDDILIVTVGAGLLLRSVPPHVIEEHLDRYEERRDSEPRRLPSASR